MSESLLSRVKTSASHLPSRVFLYAREKWGKSSLFAHATGVIFFMTRGETGLIELIAGGRVPPTAHFSYDENDPPTWSDLRQAVRELTEQDHSYRLLVIDTANGAEILCQEYVRLTQFSGSHAKFASYGKGWDACRIEWLGFLQDLDTLRARRRVGVVLLAHTRIKKFDDPTQDEGYDKYQPACQDKLWDLTHKWADVICFGHFQAETYETEQGKVKARQRVRRILCFDQSPMWEAGNRYGITGQLDISGGAKDAFATFAATLKKARAQQSTRLPQPSQAQVSQLAPSPLASSPAPEAEDSASTPLRSVEQPAAPEPHSPDVQPGENGPDSTPDPDIGHEPPPAAEPPRRIRGDVLTEILTLAHAAGLDWPAIRKTYGKELGLNSKPNLKMSDLTGEEGGRLLALVRQLKAEKEARQRPAVEWIA